MSSVDEPYIYTSQNLLLIMLIIWNKVNINASRSSIYPLNHPILSLLKVWVLKTKTMIWFSANFSIEEVQSDWSWQWMSKKTGFIIIKCFIHQVDTSFFAMWKINTLNASWASWINPTHFLEKMTQRN